MVKSSSPVGKAIFLLLFLAPILSSQPSWRLLGTGAETPSPRDRHAMAFDPIRGRTVLFGGKGDSGYLGDTWEWDGKKWTRMHPSNNPPARAGHGMAFDPVSGKVLLFGGEWKNGLLADTWMWDGKNWAPVYTTAQPMARSRFAMACDTNRKRIFLFGGGGPNGPNAYLNDTWEWDGKKWIQLHPKTKPMGRYNHCMAYDPLRKRMVVYGGGIKYAPAIHDTWEWDGTNWIHLGPPVSPHGASGCRMVYDPARKKVLLFGGYYQYLFYGETWEWDGGTWVKSTPASSPMPRMYHDMVYDSLRGRVVLFGGWTREKPSAKPYRLGDTWEWDGKNWLQAPTAASPPRRFGHVMAYDSIRQRAVLFGGGGTRGYFSDTWEWDGSKWVNPKPTLAPGPRLDAAMVFDSANGNMVLFGGLDKTYRGVSDTWAWDGKAWTQFQVPSPPCPRFGHAMAYDSSRKRVVLFGGHGGPSPYRLSDTWEWNGKTWTRLTPNPSPPARWGHAMAYDPVRKKVVLFGGSGSHGDLSDTWEWDGVRWVLSRPATSPKPRRWHGMAFDPTRGRVVLFGGYDGSRLLSDTWEWNGRDWFRIPTAATPPGRYKHRMAFYGAGGGKVLLFGGRGLQSNQVFGDTWSYTLVRRSSFSNRGTGCPGSNNLAPVLYAKNLPSIGEEFTLGLKNAPPLRPTFLFVGMRAIKFDLASLGAPGCVVLNNPDFVLPNKTNLGGTWSLPHRFRIPYEFSFLGSKVYFQCLVYDPKANKLGAIVSNGGLAVIDW